MNPWKPATWSAKAQSNAVMLLASLVSAAVAWVNTKFGWNLNPDTLVNLILGILGLGAAAGVAIAHIDHGEAPAMTPGAELKLIAATAAPIVLDEVEAAIVSKFPSLAKKLGVAITSTAMLLLAFALTACQAAPVVQGQSGRQDSGAPQSSPVAQPGNFVFAPTYIYGDHNAANTHPVDASGDLKAAESLRSGALTGGTQSGSSQSVDPAAVGDAIAKDVEALGKTVSPTGAAAGLLTSAKKKLDAKDIAGATADLNAAKAAALTEKAAPAPVTPEGVKPVVPPPVTPAPATGTPAPVGEVPPPPPPK